MRGRPRAQKTVLNDVRVKRSVNDGIGHKCNNMRKSRSNTKYKVVNLQITLYTIL